MGIVAILIIFEPDLGTTMIICITSFLMFLISGEDRIHTIGTIGIAGVLGIPLVTLAAVIEPYRLERVKNLPSASLKKVK